MSWEKLKGLGDLKIYDRLEYSNGKIIETGTDTEIIFTSKIPLPKEVIQ